MKIIRDNFARSFIARRVAGIGTSTIRDGMAVITRQDPLKKLLASRKLIVTGDRIDSTPWFRRGWKIGEKWMQVSVDREV